ncbi:MAG: CDP-alcohol phosphatidyltransferase family protein [Acidobacteriia bacterium]|nr:CDP-alcohol phosphatidyltransferase family protein [Terriglobia bacterium]
MRRETGRDKIRFLIPQVFTGARVVLGGIALFEAMRGQTHWAATWITYGAVTDGLDGIVARRLSAASDFGALFDLFADYVCYIVAPVALSLSFFETAPGAIVFVLLGSPLLAGAIRYARNIQWSRVQSFEVVGIPGLGTVIYSFFIVTLVFARPEEVIAIEWVRHTVLVLVPALSCLMISPIRFSKLMKYQWIFFPVMAGLLIMPFAFTRLFSSITLALGFLYTVISPLLMYARKESTSHD